VIRKIPIADAASMPPNTAVPTLRRLAALAPTAMTNGRRPARKEIAVIITARNRKRAAVSAASTIFLPFSRCSLANSPMLFGHASRGNALLAQHSIDFRGLIV
jgi:hypothetical protein